MKYTVVWVEEAEQELARLWNTASDRQAIANAADEIDRLLRRTPLDVGHPLPSGARILNIPPLAVDYRVFEDDRQVKVYAVGLK